MIEIVINNVKMRFETSKEVFSPSYVDCGTLAMLSKVTFKKDDKVLDLGCGYGVVGIYASNYVHPSNIIMCDISEEALNLSKTNANLNSVSDLNIIFSDGLGNISEKDFTIILSNPPYHTNFSVAKRFIEDGYRKLQVSGKMFMVTKRKEWYKRKLISVFGGVRIYEIDGYCVFEAEKRQGNNIVKSKNKKAMSKKLQRKTNMRK